MGESVLMEYAADGDGPAKGWHSERGSRLLKLARRNTSPDVPGRDPAEWELVRQAAETLGIA